MRAGPGVAWNGVLAGGVSAAGGRVPRESDRGVVRKVKPQVRGVLFPIRGVLYDTSGWRRWLLQLVSRMGLHTHYTCFYRVWEREYLPEVNSGRRDFWQALRAFLTAVGMTPGQIDEVEASGRSQRRRFEENVQPLPGVRTTLAQLAAQGVQLAALGNGPWSAAEVAEQLGKLRLTAQFPIVAPALDSDGRALAPGDRFAAALTAMQIPTHHAALISCDTQELATAADAGLQTVAFNHDDDAEADCYIEQFDQLLDALSYGPVRRLAG